jgi:hypothetical protein
MKTAMLRRLLPDAVGPLFASLLVAALTACQSGRETKSTPPAVAAPPPVAPAAPAANEAAKRASADRPPESAEQELPELEGLGWRSLFDGTLQGWRVTDFAGHGEVEIKDRALVLGMGAMLTGVNLEATNGIPTQNYELALDVMKVDGSDFFCALTFPVGDSCCSLIVGGWGGGVVGISSINGNDASLNETTSYLNFEKDRWYRVRIRVTPAKLEAWIGAKKCVDLKLEDKKITVRAGEIELSQPFGVATWQTTGAIKSVQWRSLK